MVKQKEQCVLLVIFKLAAWVGKLYVYPGRPKIVKLCKRWFGVKMSQRTLSRVLSSLLTAEYLGRQRRPYPCQGGLHRSQTSMTFLTWKSISLVSGLGGLSGLVKRLTDVPRMAGNILKGIRSSRPCGKVASLIGQVLHEGGLSGTLSCGLSPPPDPAK